MIGSNLVYKRAYWYENGWDVPSFNSEKPVEIFKVVLELRIKNITRDTVLHSVVTNRCLHQAKWSNKKVCYLHLRCSTIQSEYSNALIKMQDTIYLFKIKQLFILSLRWKCYVLKAGALYINYLNSPSLTRLPKIMKHCIGKSW